jgi:hypothetical protein
MPVFALAELNAQPVNNLPTEKVLPEPAEIGYDDISAETAGYTPHSGIYRATAETISSDVDVFMSVFDYNTVKLQNWFAYGGFDEHGVNLGYALKFSTVYLGFSYGGTLIDGLAQRIFNLDVVSLPEKENEIKENINGSVPFDPGTDGVTRREDTIGVLLGTGVFGLKLEFGSYMQSRELYSREQNPNYTHIFESSLKPSLELGWNFPIASVRTKFAFRAAYDIHEYVSNTGDMFYYFETVKEDPNDPSSGDVLVRNSKFFDRAIYQDFTEPSAGFTLRFDFGLGENTLAALDLTGNAAYRMYTFDEYDSDKEDGIKTVWKITDPVPDVGAIIEETTDFTAPEIFDLRVVANPAFSAVSKFSEMFTAGARFNVNVRYDIFEISYTKNSSTVIRDDNGNVENPVSDSFDIKSWYMSITPGLNVGLVFTPWPDHFSVQVGLGMDLFSYRKSEQDHTVNGDTISEEIAGPTVKVTAGLTMNLTPAITLDLLAVATGLDISATKLTLLLVLNK